MAMYESTVNFQRRKRRKDCRLLFCFLMVCYINFDHFEWAARTANSREDRSTEGAEKSQAKRIIVRSFPKAVRIPETPFESRNLAVSTLASHILISLRLWSIHKQNYRRPKEKDFKTLKRASSLTILLASWLFKTPKNSVTFQRGS